MKSILSALLLCGAFFSCYVTAQEYHCPKGGSLLQIETNYHCSLPAPSGVIYEVRSGTVIGRGSSIPRAAANYASQKTINWTDSNGCSQGITYTYKEHNEFGSVSFDTNQPYQTFTPGEGCKTPSGSPIISTASASWSNTAPEYYCPPDNIDDLSFQTLYQSGETRLCLEPAAPLLCDDPLGNCDPDEPPPPDCENDPLNPCEPPPCVPGGGGMMVCKDNPEDKCWVDAFGHDKCEEGCGFINDQFFCTVEGNDQPSFEKCKFTTNGYACPSEPKDDITDPDKPAEEMTKQDHKDTNVGIESRQDVTNDLLETQLAEWNRESNETQQGLADLNSNLGGKLNTANGHLSDMSQTLTDIGDFLKPADGAIDPPPAEPESWYESEYEDGITGIWEERSAALMQTPIFDFMNQFKMTPSGTQPEFRLCFDFIANFGCHSLEIPSGIWAFLRIVILITAAFKCRQIVIGS